MKHQYIFLLFISTFIFSCRGFVFDPRLYNKDSDSDTIIEEGDLEIVIPSPEDDPFKNNPDYKNPDKHFNIDKFDNWLFRVFFDEHNSATYSFDDRNGKTLALLDSSKNEYIEYQAPDTEAKGFAITEVNYYLYKSKNPFFTSEGGYNTGPHGERISRFYFYRFTGVSAGIVDLDNFLIAIDRYSKLIFMFAIPTEYKEIVGQNVPTAWGSIDVNVNNGKHIFYEYDPVGIVRDDGTILLYEWYKEATSEENYNPRMTYNTDIASYNGPGRSPYQVIITESDPFLKQILNSTFIHRSEAGVSEYLEKYSFSRDGKTLTHERIEWKGETQVIGNYSYTETIDDNTARYGNKTITLSSEGDKQSILENGNLLGINETDSGPKFVDRVKNKTFKTSDNKKYVFGNYENGDISLHYYENDVLKTTMIKFERQKEDDNTRGAFKEKSRDIFGRLFRGFELRDNDDTLIRKENLESMGTALNDPSIPGFTEWDEVNIFTVVE